MRRHLVLINEHSGRALEEGVDTIKDTLREVYADDYDVEFVVASVPELMKRAAAYGGEAVVTVGGDGTVGGVASVLYGRENGPMLIPLPYGTANLVARDLCLPLEPEEALCAALEAPRRLIDFVSVGDHALLHSAAFGSFAEMAEGREGLRRAPTFGDALDAAVHMFDSFIETHPVPYTLKLDDRVISTDSAAVFIANGAITGNEGPLPARANLDRGELVVYISKGKRVLGLIRHVLEAMAGTFDESSEFVRYTAQRVSISTAERELHYTIDGEPGTAGQSLEFVMHCCSLCVPDLREDAGVRE